METENKTKKRPQVNALYCSAEIADAVNNHPYFTGCITGADRAAKILEALDFAGKWQGHTEALNDLEQIQQDLKALQEKDKNHQNEVKSLKEERDQAIQDCNLLQSELDRANASIDTAKKNTADRDITIRQLQEANEKLEAAGNKKGWEVVRTQIDPAYAAVLEELTNRLSQKFDIQGLEPHVVLITFFMQYYYNQEWEFSGMPFVIKPNEILSIVQSVYPEITSKILSQALLVKK